MEGQRMGGGGAAGGAAKGGWLSSAHRLARCLGTACDWCKEVLHRRRQGEHRRRQGAHGRPSEREGEGEPRDQSCRSGDPTVTLGACLPFSRHRLGCCSLGGDRGTCRGLRVVGSTRNASNGQAELTGSAEADGVCKGCRLQAGGATTGTRRRGGRGTAGTARRTSRALCR